MGRSTGTRADEIHARLRADILGGVLPPGEKLAFGRLQARYDVSTGVLREVLPRLVEQGLAVSEAQLGFRVVPVSVPDLLELTETRVWVESEALRRSIAHGDVEWESAVLAARHRLSRTPSVDADGRVSDAWITAHGNFHGTLLRACPNTRLVRIAESLRDVSEVYRCWSVRSPGAVERDVDAEHGRIVEAAVDRDTERAVDELRRHIELTTSILVAGQESIRGL
ncbi:GntR family transcriptional regulator [Rhodococcus sp. SGAir0479]|uniref:GntR family transcriptional regulator n=1 Tax=Rhodococcus sp. SGAir0479 TaxID=2567884 RepID=UPI0010CD2AA2|nr:GntR family transcriptional regulator [Rhodococcus sp. SGAir0479]QCQ89922.1 GntR family transcriptional regulator [Rhodococcus sp. SGAir0479]